MPDTLLITGANCVTLDPAQPRTVAILIEDGCIRALGAAARSAQATRTIEAGGRRVLPGFQNAHVHLLNGGTDPVETAQLYKATSLAERQAALARHAGTWNGPMVRGASWQCGFFGDHNPTRDVLDPIVPDRPA